MRRRRITLASLLLASGCAAQSQPMGPPLGPPVLMEDALVAADGYRLPVNETLPDGPPVATILALHGFDDYAASFDDAAAAWAEAGIATLAFDQRGFGRTDRQGIWADTDTYIADAAMAARLAAARHGDVPLVLLGESMGAAIALLALARHPDLPVDAVILVAPAVWDWQAMPDLEEAVFVASATLLPGLIVNGEGLDLEPTDNHEVQRRMARDPYVLKENRLDTVAGLIDLMAAALGAAPTLDRPALIQLGSNETIVPEGHLRAFFAALATAPAVPVVAVYPDGFHMLLRDLSADAPIADIPAFIADPSAPLPSGADAEPLPWTAGS